jgi:quinol monooxygenase YgiN
MSIRIVLTVFASPGNGDELFALYKERCESCMKEPGCEQFEAFQSVLDPDRITVLELWKDQAALDAHAELTKTAAHMPKHLRRDSQREDYVYNRTR